MPVDTSAELNAFADPADLGFLTALIDAQAAISTVDLDPDEIVRIVLDRAQQLCGGNGAMYDSVVGEAIQCRVAVGSLEGLEGISIDPKTTLTGQAIARRQTILVEDVLSDPRVEPPAAVRESGARSFIVVPLPLDGRVVGVLKVAANRPGAFTPVHAAGMQMIAGMIAAKLAHADAFVAHERLSAERSAAMVALRASERRFRLLADNAAVGIYEADSEGRNTFVNARWAEITGTRVEDADGAGWAASIHSSDRERAIATWFAAIQAGRDYVCEFRINAADGRTLWIHSHAVPCRDEQGNVTGYIGTATDVTDRKRREWLEVDRGEVLEMLARGEALSAVLRRLAAGLSRQIEKARVAVAPSDGGGPGLIAALLDAGLPATLVEPMRPHLDEIVRAATLDPAANEADVRTIDLLSDPDFRDLRVPATVHRVRSLWLRGIRSSSGASLGSLICCTTEGRPPAQAETQAIVAASRMAALVIETRQKSERIAHAATHDPLTALPNRVTYRDRLGQAILAARRSGENVGVIAIDVDEFKSINDTRGHAVGDAVLRMFAQRLQSALRRSDTLARLSGDEFAIVLPRVAESALAEGVGRKLVATLAEPFDVHGGPPLKVTGSFGISVFPRDGDDVDALLAAADAALYIVKAHGRNGYHFRTETVARSA